MASASQNLYEILGVAHTASHTEVRRQQSLTALRKLWGSFQRGLRRADQTGFQDQADQITP